MPNHTSDTELERFSALANLIEAATSECENSAHATAQLQSLSATLRSMPSHIATEVNKSISAAIDRAREEALADLKGTSAAAVAAKNAYERAAKFAVYKITLYALAVQVLIAAILFGGLWIERRSLLEEVSTLQRQRADLKRLGADMDVRTCPGERLCIKVLTTDGRGWDYAILYGH